MDDATSAPRHDDEASPDAPARPADGVAATRTSALLSGVHEPTVRQIPNALSIARFPLALSTVFGLWLGGGLGLAVAAVSVALAMFTDWADGRAARALGVVSDFGKLLDPLADAVFFIALFIGIAALGMIPWWLAVPFVVREVVQHAYVRPAALRLGVALAARMIGKIKTTIQGVVAGLIVVCEAARTWPEAVARWTGLAVPNVDAHALLTIQISVAIAAVVSIASLVPYLRQLAALRRERAARDSA